MFAYELAAQFAHAAPLDDLAALEPLARREAAKDFSIVVYNLRRSGWLPSARRVFESATLHCDLGLAQESGYGLFRLQISGGVVAVADLSREESKRLRAELAEGLGFYPASLAPEDVALYRDRSWSARPERRPVSAMGGVRAGTSGASGITSGKNGVAHEIETRGRASVADLYD